MTKNIIVILLLTSSCANISFSVIAPLAKTAIFGYESVPVSKNDIQKTQYSFIIMKFERGGEAKLILSEINEFGLQKWVGQDGVAIYTLNGKVVKTEGLDHNLEILDLRNTSVSKQKDSLVFFKNPNAFFNQDISFAQPIKTSINFHYQGNIPVTLIKESVMIDELNWKKENLYWLDGAQIKRTVQFLNPKLPSVTIDFFYIY